MTDNKSASAQRKQRVFLGFDAFIDHIVKPIKSGSALNPEAYFESMNAFGQFLSERDGMNCSVELQSCVEKLGGNAPITANALISLDVDCVCVGGFGLPEINPVFAELSERAELISVSNPGMTTALEFGNGKVMLGINKDINSLGFEHITERVSKQGLIEHISKSDLLMFLNWSELPRSTEIYKGFASEVLPHVDGEKILYMDLSDCARRDMSEVQELCEVIKALPRHIHVYLSLNRNEDRIVCGACGIDADKPDEIRAQALVEALGLEGVILHRRERCHMTSKSGSGTSYTELCKTPAVSTGAGDNLNACICKGLLLGMSPLEIVEFATAGSGFYVENGYSGSMDQVRNRAKTSRKG